MGEDEKMSISEFSAVVVSNKIIDFLIVLDKSEGEEFAAYARSIVLSKTEKGFNTFDIDMCKTVIVPLDQVFVMPEKCFLHPALGGKCKSIGKMDATQSKRIKSMMESQGALNIKVTRMIPKKKGSAASVECD